MGRIKINEIGTASYTMSSRQWMQRTNAIGLISKGGKYSIGTYNKNSIEIINF